MSFILDALKKSETDRQQQASAEFAAVPTSPGRRSGPPAWLWVVGALLLINLAVLIGILLRPDVAPVEEPRVAAAVPTESAVEAAPIETAPANDFASQVAVARENPPARAETPAVEVGTEPEGAS